jgi:hypothetical protein
MGKRGLKRYSKTVWPSQTSAPLPRRVTKVKRNDPCPCGSGKKYKDCHEKEGSAYLEKLAREEDKERLKAKREEWKKKGVPWYKRWFSWG